MKNPSNLSARIAGRGAGLYRDILLLCLLTLVTTVASLIAQARKVRLPAMPQVQAKNHVVSLTLRAVRDASGHDRFSFNGQTVPPVIRVSPGDTLKITYINDLPPASGELCSTGPCQIMTNLHFHGLVVSPKASQDDVLE
jgi:FtsP/CotA-like multicopper oxidase with cupredoxin domain